ncbi:GspH/FimT family pseudopilin [Dyella halodurans]|uniref:Type II secretion system protein H n=1 Tax=Dyella halodurans TaxID=1920171 RepID=A0ABV9C6F2_9GAMM|nr:GspH/FimT family pseudopilin [Dyella halodurans]
MRQGQASPRYQRGFTLIEQIVAGLIVAMLACMAAPALGALLSRSRLQAAQLDLISALNHARALAATTGRRTMLCPSRDGLQCADEVHWEGGWLIGHYRTSQTDQIDGKPLLTGPGHPTLTILSTSGRRRVRFQNDGSAVGSNVTFTLCVRGRTGGTLSVVVSDAGRIKSPKTKPDQASRCTNGD